MTDSDKFKNYLFYIIENLKTKPYILLLEDFERSFYFENQNNSDTFLNIIDGVYDSDGQILIITSNDPEKIKNDKALTRPGRIDEFVYFGCCTKYQLEKIYNYYFNNIPNKKSINKITFKDNIKNCDIEHFFKSNPDIDYDCMMNFIQKFKK